MNNILLICGGNSVEHEISVITALQLINKYKGKYKLHLCYLKNGEFYYVKKHNDYSFYNNTSKLHKINFKANKHFVTVGFKKICFDGILLGVHGINCEDGTLYSYFKTLNINVINENIYSASVGQDKVFSKKLSEVNYIPYLYVDRWLFAKDKKKILNFCENVSFPVIVKPNNLGSSVGLSSINNFKDLIDELDFLFNICDGVIIEKQLDNFEEYNIALLRYKNSILVSEIEKVSNNKILTYQDKYQNSNKSMCGQTKELPANINSSLKNEIIEMAKKIYVNLRASGIVRIDFLYDKTNNILLFNEINNIPGSFSTYLFEKANINTSDLIDMLIDEGLYNCDINNKLITSYKNNIFIDNTFNNVKFNK